MPIACALFENNITSDPDDYAAMVRSAAVPTATTWLARITWRSAPASAAAPSCGSAAWTLF